MTERASFTANEDGRHLQPGQQVDRYVVESTIGVGGTATVYRVTHSALGSSYALKVLSLLSPSIKRRTLQEGRVQAQLRHRNIVAVYDVLDVFGAPGLLMEHVSGPPLDVALDRYAFPRDQAEVLFRGIIEGVRRAHGIGLVHRDLKPANVLLAETPQGIVPKVTDFGIAKAVEQGDTSHTRAGVAMGTPQYMAPEQIRDAKSVDRRADVFSLGCILYELVTGQRAFPHDDIVKVYNAISDGDYVDPSVLVPDLPERIRMAIRGALRVDKDRRIPDCETLLEVFEGARTWTDDDETELLDIESVDLPYAPDAIEDTYLPPDVLGLTEDEAFEGPDDLHTDDLPLASLPSGTLADPAEVAEVEAEPAPDSPSTRRLAALMAVLLVAATVFAVWGAMSRTDEGVVPPTAPDAPAEADIQAPPSPAEADADPTPAEAGPAQDPHGLDPHGAPSEAEADDPPEPETPAADPSAADGPPESPDPSPKPRRRRAADADDHAVRAERPAATPAPEPTPEPKPQPSPEPEPEPASAPAAPPAVAAPAVVARLLSAPPTAQVWVDGEAEGRTPRKLELPAGLHEVRMRSGERETSFRIVVSEGEANKWCYLFAEERKITGSCPR